MNKSVPSGANGYGEPRAESPLGLKFRRGPALGGAFVVYGFIRTPAIQMCDRLARVLSPRAQFSHRQRQTLLRGIEFTDQLGIAQVLADDVGQQS